MRRRLAALALALSAALPAGAQAPGPAMGVAGVALLPGWRQADGSHLAAIEFRLKPGWHTYWRMPGPAGVPPRFDWSGSGNLGSVAYEWPRPLVFDSFGIATIGYHEALVLPVVLKPARPGEDIEVELMLDFAVCDEICVPAEARLTAMLPAEGTGGQRAQIEAARAARPLSAGEAGVATVACRLAPEGKGLALTAEVTFAKALGREQVVVLESADPNLWIGVAETRTDGRSVVARARVEGAGGGTMIDRSGLRLTLLDARRAVDIQGCKAPG
jgi:DsbC/DsbD-like thiol-disulfide interchange protein